MPGGGLFGALTAEEVRRRRDRGRRLADEGSQLPGRRVVVLGTFTLDLLPPFLVEAADRAGFRADVQLGSFGQVVEQALDAGSPLYADDPDTVVLILSPEDLLAPVYERPAAPAVAELAAERTAELEAAAEALLARLPAAHCYVALLPAARVPGTHALSLRAPERGQVALDGLANGVGSLAELSPRIVVLDTRELGNEAALDRRLWYTARMRLAPAGLAALAELVARHVGAVAGIAKKVVAVDLDDVLWGGVVGEVGASGIELGPEGLGLAFQDFQRELLKLHDLGVLLVLASKNNAADVEEAFADNPNMILGRDHFVAERVDWVDKAANLVSIAEELSLGLDSFVFLDDNPVERDLMRTLLPDVVVPELPEDPVDRPSFVAELPYFGRIETTDADRGRAASYHAQGVRRRLSGAATSLEDFIAALEQAVAIEPVTSATLARAAQLCQRTNQFNLTTKRYTVADIEQLANDPATEVYTVSVADRYGDNGITGVTVLELGEAAVIDSFLLSCRILGRRVEDAVLAFLAREAGAHGARTLVGRFVPSAKNGLAADFYAHHGFTEVTPGVHELQLAGAEIGFPPGISVTAAARA